MANENKGTVYQNLNKMLNLDGFGFESEEGTSVPQSGAARPKIIIKGDSPQDIQRKGLELQQKEELRNKFFKTTDHGFQKAMQYEAARLPAYLDYEGMEYYPIIASALDLFMEEATTIGSNGNMLNIYSDKDRIKTHLEELFYDVINVNVNLPFWTRNLCKYGDNFVYLLGEKKRGITHVKQMVNYEIERIERINKGKQVVKFKQRETGDEFNIFEIAHFRLLGHDKYLPYGSSMLNKIRRVFRQLIMAEDAMLTYRIIRAGEKRVFKIDVGNIDEDDVEEYIQKVATRFKKQVQVNGQDGQIDYRFNIMGNDEDFFIPVRNANVQTGIDTLAGAQNLDQIQDIEYLRDNLFTGLSVPKPFLGFQEVAGDGKNLAQMDVRFLKKINRVQQAMIQELNKIAVIHLFLLGFDKEDLGSFTLSLSNPSTQQQLLNAELMQQQAQVYAEMTRNEGGIAAMSHTKAKRIVLNMSDKDIVDDLKMQRMERAIAQELQDSPLIIRKTGVFDDVDEKYGDPEAAAMMSGQTGMEGGMDDMGGMEGMPEPMGGDLGGGDMGGGDFGSAGALPPVIGQGKGFKEGGNVIGETEEAYFVKRKKMTDETFNSIAEKIVYGDNKEKKKKDEKKKVIRENTDRNRKLNDTALDMVGEIDKLIQNSDNINEHKDLDPKIFDNIDIDLDFEEKKGDD